jgi:hypothetical protein
MWIASRSKHSPLHHTESKQTGKTDIRTLIKHTASVIRHSISTIAVRFSGYTFFNTSLPKNKGYPLPHHENEVIYVTTEQTIQ